MRSEKLMLSNNINDYRIVSQGVTKIPDVDDAAEWVMIDVRLNRPKISSKIFLSQFYSILYLVDVVVFCVISLTDAIFSMALMSI